MKQLYYEGCLKHNLGKQAELYKKILNKLGVSYKKLDEEVCCGAKLYELGYETEARKLARKNLNMFKQAKIVKIITPCSECYKFLSQNYKEILPDWDIEVEHVFVTILRELDKKQKLVKNSKLGEEIFYHNDCYLQESKIINEPKNLLKILGYEVINLDDVCGGCGCLNIANPELAEKITLAFFKQVEKAGINKIIAIGECYLHLKKFKPARIEVVELGEAVAYGLDLK